MTDPGATASGQRRRAELHFAGQSLIEYQARQAQAAGAGHVLILVDDISPVLTGAVDRLAEDGVHATLLRDLPTLGRMIGNSDQILLIGDGQILPRDHIAMLAGGDGARVLALPSGPATQGFERIDADHMWAGALVAPAPMLIGLIDMLGDWDLPLTFLRQAVQEGAPRTLCDMTDMFDGRIVIATDQAVADAATQALARTYDRRSDVQGDIDDWPVGRPAAIIAPFVIRHELSPAMLRNLAIGIGTLGLVAILGGLVLLGCLICFAALVADRVAAQLDRLLRLVSGGRPLDHAVAIIVLIAILTVGLLSGGGTMAGTSAMLCVGLIALSRIAQRKGLGRDVPDVLKFAPGTALLLLAAGALFGAVGSMFAICTVLAFASHANQLLRA